MANNITEAFLSACERGDLQVFKQLVSKIDINEKNENGYTGLALAVRNGHTEIVYELIRADADINAVNEAGQSVLFLACWHNREDCIKLLLSFGALHNVPDNRGWTPLIISVYHNYLHIVQILLENGADPLHKDCFGKKAIERAKSSEIIDLLEKYENIGVKDKRVNTSVLGKIMNSSISSIQSETRPPKHPDQKKTTKLQEDIESHVKLQTHKIQNDLIGEWSEILDHCINEEISQAEEILIQEIEAFIFKSLQENYLKIKEVCLNSIDETYRNKGFKLPITQLSSNFTAPVSLSKKIRTKRSIEKISLDSDDAYFDTSSTDPNDLRLEVVKYIEKTIESLGSKFEKISQGVIANEIPQRLYRLKDLVLSEVQDLITEAVASIKNNLEQTMQQRIEEILASSRKNTEFNSKEPTTSYYSPPEQSYKSKNDIYKPSYEKKLEYYKNQEFHEPYNPEYDEKPEPYKFKNPEKYEKPKYEENYEFIENLANNYSSSKTNFADPPNLSGSFTRDNKPQKKPLKKDEKPAIPRTDVSAILQQFLKK